MALIAALFIAHISMLDGRASVTTAQGRTFHALRNMPLVASDTIATQANSRLEIQLDPNVSLRLDQGSRLELVALAYGKRDVRLFAGTIAVSMLRPDDAPHIDTPPAVLEPEKPGSYRVALTEGSVTTLVRNGTLSILTPNGNQVLSPREQVTIAGTRSQPELEYGKPPPPDTFDAYNAARDNAIAAAEQQPQLPHSLNGYANLADYGNWTTLAPYGQVWQPREYPGWAPYQLGRWFRRSETGWTWIAKESWGWIPYHYGAWIYDAALGWCWIPPSSANARWSPSNAAFFAVIARGHTTKVGWLPLAPQETAHAKLDQYRNVRGRGALTLLWVGDFYSGNFSSIVTQPLQKLPRSIRIQTPPLKLPLP
jgi:hypothetical protein